MHQQIRSAPTLSPANLEAFLEVLTAADINILAAGGSDIELGGEFAFGVAHSDIEPAVLALVNAGYAVRVVDVDTCALVNEPGELMRCIAGVASANRANGKRIKDIIIGVADGDGRIPVQIYSEGS